MKNYNDTSENYEIIYDLIQEWDMSAETLLLIFTNYHGLQILDKGFMEYLESEGYY